MKVVLFCGGLGTRIREYSEAIPKPMIPVGHQPSGDSGVGRAREKTAVILPKSAKGGGLSAEEASLTRRQEMQGNTTLYVQINEAAGDHYSMLNKRGCDSLFEWLPRILGERLVRRGPLSKAPQLFPAG